MGDLVGIDWALHEQSCSQPPLVLVITNAQIPRCDATRGPRSSIICELPYTHDEDWHHGRGRIGQWYHWPDNEGYDGRLRRRQRSVMAALEVGTPLWL